MGAATQPTQGAQRPVNWHFKKAAVSQKKEKSRITTCLQLCVYRVFPRSHGKHCVVETSLFLSKYLRFITCSTGI
jgi:hypothetical protein